MGWIIESLANVILELINDLLSLVVDLVSGLQLDIGYEPEKVKGAGKTAIGSLLKFLNPGKAMQTGLFDKVFPGAKDYTIAFLVLGMTLVLFIMAWKLFQGFAGPFTESEEPVIVIFRSIGAAFGVVYSFQVFVILEKTFNGIYKLFMNVYKEQTAGISGGKDVYALFGTDLIKNTASDYHFGSGIAFTLVLVAIGFAILTTFCMLTLEVFQRYVIIGLMYYSCPIAFAMLCSKGTRRIFSAWVQMLLSQFVLMAMNLFFLGTFIQAFYALMERGEKDGVVFKTGADFIITFMLLIAWLIVGRQIDELMKGLGLSVAQTGNGLASAVIAGATAGVSMISMPFAVGRGAAQGAESVGSLFGISPREQVEETLETGTIAGAVHNTFGKDNLSRDKGGNLTSVGARDAWNRNNMTFTGSDFTQMVKAANIDLPKGADPEKSSIQDGIGIVRNENGDVIGTFADASKVSISEGMEDAALLRSTGEDGKEYLSAYTADMLSEDLEKGLQQYDRWEGKNNASIIDEKDASVGYLRIEREEKPESGVDGQRTRVSNFVPGAINGENTRELQSVKAVEKEGRPSVVKTAVQRKDVDKVFTKK